MCWDDCYFMKKMYNYSDLIKKDLKKINLKWVIPFLIIIWVVKIILILQISIFIVFYVYYKFNKNNIKPFLNRKNVIIDLLINNSKVTAFMLRDLKIEEILKIEVLKLIFININTIIIWGYPKIIIEYSLIITKYIKNWTEKNPKKKNLSEIKNLIKGLINTNFTERIKNFENTL